MTNNKINFTKGSLTNLPTPTLGKRAYYYDIKTRGLGICVLPTGKKTFIVYRKINGRPERITIGDINDFSIEQVRGKAAEINALIAQGENPAQKQRLSKAEITLGDLFAEYLNRHAKVHKSSWKEDERQFNFYLLSWKQRKLSSIRKNDIQKLHQTVGKDHGIYAANRLLAMISCLC